MNLLAAGRILAVAKNHPASKPLPAAVQKTAIEIGRYLKIVKEHADLLASPQGNLFFSGLTSLADLMKQNRTALVAHLKFDDVLFSPKTLQRAILYWKQKDPSEKTGLIKLFDNPQQAAACTDGNITPLITHLREIYMSGLLREAAHTQALRAETCPDPKEKKIRWQQAETLYTWLILIGEQENARAAVLTKDINALRAVIFQNAEANEAQTPSSPLPKVPDFRLGWGQSV